jgi:hypothetical protein
MRLDVWLFGRVEIACFEMESATKVFWNWKDTFLDDV